MQVCPGVRVEQQSPRGPAWAVQSSDSVTSPEVTMAQGPGPPGDSGNLSLMLIELTNAERDVLF